MYIYIYWKNILPKKNSAPKQLNLKAKWCQHITNRQQWSASWPENHHGIRAGLNDRAQVFMMRHVPKIREPSVHSWLKASNNQTFSSLSESMLYIVYIFLLLGRPTLPHFIGPPSPTNDNSFPTRCSNRQWTCVWMAPSASAWRWSRYPPPSRDAKRLQKSRSTEWSIYGIKNTTYHTCCLNLYWNKQVW